MSRIGIIVNPMSGKDVRRIIGYASVVDAVEKVEVVRRILAGLQFFGIEEIYFMPDPDNYFKRVMNSLHKKDLDVLEGRVRVLDFPPMGEARDSMLAAEIMNGMNVDCIITLGGDGTCKAVASSCGETPVLPVSTGTNNVFPYRIDGTIAGLVAGAFAKNYHFSESMVRRANMFNVYVNGDLVNHALIDVVLYNEPFISSRAMWEPEKLLFVAISGPILEPVIGMSSVAQIAQGVFSADVSSGFACSLNPQKPKMKIVSPIAPGLMSELIISETEVVKSGRKYRIGTELPVRWCTVAVDGEREVEVDLNEDVVEFELIENMVRVVEPWKVYSEALRDKNFQDSPKKVCSVN